MSWESIDLPSIKDYKDHPDQEYFKGWDKFGNIVRIFNPAKLRTWVDKEGRSWVSRPKPTILERKEGGSKKRKERDSLF